MGVAPVRRGFTLIEMLVSLGVLAVALGVIGVVFTVTARTTRQAAAYSDVHHRVQQFLFQLEEDLKYCEPATSLLVLVGRKQATALTQDNLNARRFYRVLTGDPQQVQGGYDPEFDPDLDPPGSDGVPEYSNPRADILAFFSHRHIASQAPPLNPTPGSLGEACARGTRFSPTWNVYGHAALDDAVYNGVQYVFAGNPQHLEQMVDGSNPDPNKLSRIPANQWHLAGRRTIVQARPYTGPPTFPADVQFSQATCQRIPRCQPAQEASEWMPGDAAYLNVPLLLESLSANFWGQNDAPLQSPYQLQGSGPWGGQWQLENVRSIHSLLYATYISEPPLFHHVATVIARPPPELQSNLGVHLLPGCAWFQVEFLMPEDPRNSLDYARGLNWGVGPYSERQDMPRWTEVEPGGTYVFVPDTAENRELICSQVDGTGVPYANSRLATFAQVVPPSPSVPAPGGPDNVANRRVRLWPYAIRITVRAFDPEGRLEQPLVRSIVHRFD